jgi:hypothetical protein
MRTANLKYFQLFMRVQDDETWWEPPYHKPRFERLDKMKREVVEEMLNDPTYIKAVFFRDPASR